MLVTLTILCMRKLQIITGLSLYELLYIYVKPLIKQLNKPDAFLHYVWLDLKMEMKWAENDFVHYTRGKKEVRGEGREDLTLQMVCPLHSNNKIQTSAFSFTCMLLWWWNFDSIIQRNFMNKYFFLTLSQWREVILSSSDWIIFCHKWFELFGALAISLC